MLNSIFYKSVFKDFAFLILRVFTGALLIHHGFEKLNDINNFADAFVRPLHLPFPVTLSYIAAGSEIGGSWLLILGLATRLGASAILGTMSVAIYHAIVTSGFNIYLLELLALYFSSAFSIILLGPGMFSADYLINEIFKSNPDFSFSIFTQQQSSKTKSFSKMISSKEIVTLINALGLDPKAEEIDLDDLRYGKIIIMTDADVDGSHIRALLLTFFNNKPFNKLIENGNIFLAQPPLFKINKSGKSIYIKDEKSLENFILNNSKNSKKIKRGSKEFEKLLSEEKSKLNIQRFKGLGEMNPEELWNTTLDPQTRNLLQVQYSKDLKKDQSLIHTLMGNDVALRKNFIVS